ncbi:MAG: WYL domain-containing protein, partial [Geodermatophilaceae bacterium]
LIDDIARRHGGLRVGAASTYLRSDDQTLIAQVTADRRLADYGLRLLAPGVLISPTEVDELLDALRSAGYAPAAESAGGVVVSGLAARLRAPGRRGSPAPRLHELTAEQRETVVRRMRTGDTAAAAQRRTRALPAIPGVTTATILETLQRAIREDEGLWIGYVNADGQSSQRFIEPLTLTGGFLTAYDHRREEQRTFAVHRITSVTVADD